MRAVASVVFASAQPAPAVRRVMDFLEELLNAN